MSDKQYTIADMLAAARQSSPTEFQAAFSDVFVNKVADAIAGKRTEVAQNYFNFDTVEVAQPDETQEEEPNEDVETSAGSEGGETADTDAG